MFSTDTKNWRESLDDKARKRMYKADKKKIRVIRKTNNLKALWGI